ncbi:competence protein ComK [Bacillus sp. V33-4]|uniref:competence protein ComK n=1 Tax=Bacillus sp. V33-4 TaxID=2054169 RepID=UPI0015E0E4C3|nr:competence protein ComK [Bacillus sp. V33-4]
MFIEPHYIINQYFMYITGHYGRNAKLCTQIKETEKTFFVDKPPLEILADSIRAIGFDLRGAMQTAKTLLGDVHMCPVMVNPIHKIVLFPTIRRTASRHDR